MGIGLLFSNDDVITDSGIFIDDAVFDHGIFTDTHWDGLILLSGEWAFFFIVIATHDDDFFKCGAVSDDTSNPDDGISDDGAVNFCAFSDEAISDGGVYDSCWCE